MWMGLNRHRDRWICTVSDDLRSASSKHPKGQTLPSAGRDELRQQVSICLLSHSDECFEAGSVNLTPACSISLAIPCMEGSTAGIAVAAE